MPINDEAFISEIRGKGFGEQASGQFLEITIKKTADISDYVISLYMADDNALADGYSSGPRGQGSSFFPDRAEFSLAEIALLTGTISDPVGAKQSGLPGGDALDILWQENPNNADYWTLIIPMSFASDDASDLGVNIVTLTNLKTGESEGYNLGGGSNGPLVGGVADGTIVEPTTTANASFNSLGQEIPTNDISPGTAVITCFTSACRIETISGPVAIKDIAVGDLVRTFDQDYRPVKFIYKRTFPARGRLRPVYFARNAIGNSSAIEVSQNHRFLVSMLPRDIAVKFGGYSDVLVKAIELTNDLDIYVNKQRTTVTYHHLMFDQHQLIFCEGTVSESWQPHRRVLRGHPDMREALLAALPDFETRPNRIVRPEVFKRLPAARRRTRSVR